MNTRIKDLSIFDSVYKKCGQFSNSLHQMNIQIKSNLNLQYDVYKVL